MAWTNRKGFNFRSTLAYVADGTNETFRNATGAYPQSITVDGDTFNVGWETAPAGSRDRSTAVDTRLAGVVYVPTSGGVEAVFRVDLPAAGNYKIRLALGDAGFPNHAKVAVRDTTTDVITIAEVNTATGEFVDASGVKRTSAADWVTNQVEVTVAFATTVCRLALLVPTGGNSSCVAHFSIAQAAPPPVATLGHFDPEMNLVAWF